MNRKTLVLILGAISACLMLAVGLILVALFVFVPRAQAKQLMHYTFTQGQKISQQVVMDQTVSMTFMGQEQTVKQTIGMGYDMVVTELLPDNSARLTLTYTSIKFMQDNTAGKVDYESTTPVQTLDPNDKDFAGKVYGAMIGESYSFIISSAGYITEFQGVDEMLRRIYDKFDVSEAEKAQYVEAIQGQFNEDSLLDMMGDISTPYSSLPVKVGDTWNETQVVSTMYPMILENTYKLIERSGKKSVIQVNTIIKPNPDGKPLEIGGVTFRYEMEGTQEGQIEVDSTGWTLNGRYESSITGTMSMVMEGTGAKNMEVPVTMKSVVTYKSIP